MKIGFRLLSLPFLSRLCSSNMTHCIHNDFRQTAQRKSEAGEDGNPRHRPLENTSYFSFEHCSFKKKHFFNPILAAVSDNLNEYQFHDDYG